MDDNHTKLCERLIEDIGKAILGEGSWHVAIVLSRSADFIKSQAARIQQQALEYVSLFDQCREHLARIAELEKERDALKADAERWREFAEHQTWCADCADSVSTCPIGIRLQEAALQAEKETRS